MSMKPSLIAVGVLICSWIILTNSVVFLCLVTSKKTKQIALYLQLLSLCLTDMLVGFCTIPVFLAPITSLFSKYEACACIFYMYFVSQGATLYHTLLVCIHRLLTMRRKSNVNKESFNTTLVQISLIWIGCFIFYSIPFVAFGQFGGDVVSCSMPALFGQNYSVVTGLGSILFILPYCCINILYVYLLVYLKKRWRAIHVDTTLVTSNRSNELEDIGQRGNNYEFDHCGMTHVEGPTEAKLDMHEAKSTAILGGNPGTSKDTSKINCRTIHVKEPDIHAVQETQFVEGRESIMMRRGLRNFKANTNMQKDIGRRRIHGTHINKNRSVLKSQRRVLFTIGIILTALDVCMTPMVFLPVFENVQFEYINRSSKYVCLTMAMLSSALNPVINVSMIKPFRQGLKDTAKKVLQSFGCGW